MCHVLLVNVGVDSANLVLRFVLMSRAIVSVYAAAAAAVNVVRVQNVAATRPSHSITSLQITCIYLSISFTICVRLASVLIL